VDQLAAELAFDPTAMGKEIHQAQKSERDGEGKSEGDVVVHKKFLKYFIVSLVYEGFDSFLHPELEGMDVSTGSHRCQVENIEKRNLSTKIALRKSS
jgi:hypothetical protein